MCTVFVQNIKLVEQICTEGFHRIFDTNWKAKNPCKIQTYNCFFLYNCSCLDQQSRKESTEKSLRQLNKTYCHFQGAITTTKEDYHTFSIWRHIASLVHGANDVFCRHV